MVQPGVAGYWLKEVHAMDYSSFTKHQFFFIIQTIYTVPYLCSVILNCGNHSFQDSTTKHLILWIIFYNLNPSFSIQFNLKKKHTYTHSHDKPLVAGNRLAAAQLVQTNMSNRNCLAPIHWTLKHKKLWKKLIFSC